MNDDNDNNDNDDDDDKDDNNDDHNNDSPRNCDELPESSQGAPRWHYENFQKVLSFKQTIPVWNLPEFVWICLSM
jgi:hypothetical protein